MMEDDFPTDALLALRSFDADAYKVAVEDNLDFDCNVDYTWELVVRNDLNEYAVLLGIHGKNCVASN